MAGIKFLAKMISARALELNDLVVYEQMNDVINEKYNGKLAIKAEIIFHVKTPSSSYGQLYVTYNEFRKIGNASKYNTNGFRWMRNSEESNNISTSCGSIDKIACKLYEKHEEYALKNGKVNCSCNFIGGTWSKTTSGSSIVLKSSNSNITGRALSDLNVGAQVMPNLCSIKIGNKYYSLGLRDENGNLISGKVSVGSKTITAQGWATNVSGASFMTQIGMSCNSPVIFEGWDYIWHEVVKESIKNYTVIERYVDKNSMNEIASNNIISVICDSNYTPDLKNISGYTYQYTDPSEKNEKFKVTEDITITHYYASNSYNVIEKYLEKGSEKEIAPSSISTIFFGGSYKPDKKTIKNYDYDSTIPIDKDITFKVDSDVTIIHYYTVSKYEVVEKYLVKGTNVQIAPEKITNVVCNSKYIPEIYNIKCYTYSSSTPAEKTKPFNVTENITIIHYYTLNEYYIKINYQDTEGNPIEILPNSYDVIIEGNKFEKKISNKVEDFNGDVYLFVKMSEVGKTLKNELNDIIIDPVIKSREFIVIYEKVEKTAPVVSYPKVNKEVVILGESIKVSIPNDGHHAQMDLQGFSAMGNDWNLKNAQTKYLTFPFDIIYNEKIIKAGTEILVAERNGETISEDEIEIFIPEWIEEGNYTVLARVSTLDNSKINKRREKNDDNYWNNLEIYENTAIGKVNIEVTGKIYDFTITNLIEDKQWSTSLFSNVSEYKALKEDESVGALPIGQGKEIQEPDKYNYGVGLGSTFFFTINTIGLKNEGIEITPKFIYVDENGKINNDVDFYYIENKRYIKISESSTILKTKLNNEYKKVRTNLVAEMLAVKNNSHFNILSSIGTYNKLLISKNLKTPFVEYLNTLNYDKIDNTQKQKLYEAISHWYGEYRMPASTVVVKKGDMPKSNGATEYKNGYVIVLFKINTVSDGKTYLKYENQYVGNQWKNESTIDNLKGETITLKLPKLIKQEKEITLDLSLSEGDYPVAIYEVNQRITSSNYDTAGTH